LIDANENISLVLFASFMLSWGQLRCRRVEGKRSCQVCDCAEQTVHGLWV